MEWEGRASICCNKAQIQAGAPKWSSSSYRSLLRPHKALQDWICHMFIWSCFFPPPCQWNCGIGLGTSLFLPIMHRSEGSFGRPHPERRTRRRRFGFYFGVAYARCFPPPFASVSSLIEGWACGSVRCHWRAGCLYQSQQTDLVLVCNFDTYPVLKQTVSPLPPSMWLNWALIIIFFFTISISHLPLWWYSLLLPQLPSPSPPPLHVTLLLLLLLLPPPRVRSHF